MTKRELFIFSAYTGYLFMDWADFKAFAEQELGRPIQTPLGFDADINAELRLRVWSEIQEHMDKYYKKRKKRVHEHSTAE